MKTRFKLIRLDDTANWNIADIEKHYGKIYCVYLYDANQVTNCCEITPSYYLIPLYSYAEKEISEAQQDVIDENADLSEAEGIYMHCADVDKIEKQSDCWRGLLKYETEEEYKELEEETIEYYKGNWCL